MRQVLLIDCDDQKGLVAKISQALFRRDVNIISNREFVDPVSTRFFMRTEFEGESDAEGLTDEVRSLLPTAANVRLADKREKRIVVLGTKEPHCLGDILIRCAYHTLNARIAAVICNHDELRPLVEKFDVPFHTVSHEGRDRLPHAMEILETVQRYTPHYVVLAKYMRILPPELVLALGHAVINIHHSFLPAFIGANPYKQAYTRGVKIIGATAHFVDEGLDQGPIICQDVIPVNHRHTAKDMAAAGKDVEKTVLSKALALVIDDRVFVSGNKTVVFD